MFQNSSYSKMLEARRNIWLGIRCYSYHRCNSSSFNPNAFKSSYLLPNQSLKAKIATQNVQRTYTAGSNNGNSATNKLNLMKNIFYGSLCIGTVCIGWFVHQKKIKNLKYVLEDCQRLPIDETLFDSDVSIYRYKGYIFPGQIIMSGVLKEMPKFQFRENDVIVASFPKAGTTWVQEIVYMLTHNLKKSDANSQVLETRFPYLEYPYPGIKSIEAQKGQRCIKTHLPYSLLPSSFVSSGAKLVYIMRNPRDVTISYWYFMQLLTPSSFTGSLQEFIKMFFSNKVPYSPFFDHVQSYWEVRADPNILVISYEQLREDPISIIRKIATFLEIDVSDEDVGHIDTCTSFKSMSENPSVNYEHWKDLGFAHKERGNFLRKGNVGDWLNKLNFDEVTEFKKWEENHLLKTDLRFTYFPHDFEDKLKL